MAQNVKQKQKNNLLLYCIFLFPKKKKYLITKYSRKISIKIYLIINPIINITHVLYVHRYIHKCIILIKIYLSFVLSSLAAKERDLGLYFCILVFERFKHSKLSEMIVKSKNNKKRKKGGG